MMTEYFYGMAIAATTLPVRNSDLRFLYRAIFALYFASGAIVVLFPLNITTLGLTTFYGWYASGCDVAIDV